jgi:glycosyltransferase involved in cell wall biosynthesis
MRIAYLHYLVDDDTALHHVRQFATAAKALGHRLDVHAMNLAAHGGQDVTQPTAGTRLRAQLRKSWGRFLHEPKELLWNARYVGREAKLLRANLPDVLLVRDHLLTASCVPVARRLHLPLVVEVNAPATESRLYLSQYMHLPFVPEWLEGWKLRNADAVTVVSSSLKDHLVERYGITSDKIAVIPNGADVDLFRPDAAADPVIVRRSPDEVVIGFVGSFQRWHGTELLASLIDEVARARRATRFLLVGDGPEAGQLRAAARGLGERVLFTGMVSHHRVPGLVAGLDIGVLPEADFYRCPLKVIEWMAAGKAVVAPDYGPLRDLLGGGRYGVLVRPRDPRALNQAVLALIDDPARRGALGAAAAAHARADLSWTHNARRVLATCERALRHRDNPVACAA